MSEYDTDPLAAAIEAAVRALPDRRELHRVDVPDFVEWVLPRWQLLDHAGEEVDVAWPKVARNDDDFPTGVDREEFRAALAASPELLGLAPITKRWTHE